MGRPPAHRQSSVRGARESKGLGGEGGRDGMCQQLTVDSRLACAHCLAAWAPLHATVLQQVKPGQPPTAL